MKIDHQELFPTPVFQIELSNIDNRELENGVYKIKENDKGIKLSNNGGWHSNTQSQQLNIIFKPFIDELIKVLPELPFEPKIKSLSNINLWANINPKGSYNNSHNHPGCDISGVYYVKVPKGKCGNIAFNDPRESYAYGNRFFVDRYTKGETIPRYPVEGTMFLFPSCLHHEVSINETDEDRISLAFNLNIQD